MANAVIKVGVSGGLVQWITGIPQDVQVLVFDYDVDGIADERLNRDDEGNRCIIAIYEATDAT